MKTTRQFTQDKSRPQRERLLADQVHTHTMQRSSEIDIFRGLNILEMENTESCDHPFFDHAEYEDMRLNYADTIFPCFAFISGMLLKPTRVVPVRKSVQLIGLGMAFNAIPCVMEGTPFRPLGVLQRHGLSSIILNNVVPVEWRNSIKYPIALTTLWYLISIVLATDKWRPFQEQKHTAQQKIDSPFFKGRTYHEHFDPEGLLGALMTAVSIWSGAWFSNNVAFTNWQTLLLGSGFFSAGYLISKILPNYFPMSKPLWSPAFVLATNGVTILKYLLLKVSMPYLPNVVSHVLAVVGRHSLEVYFLGEITLLGLKYKPAVGGKSIWTRIESFLSKYLPRGLTQTLLTVAFDAALVGFALLCNSKGWKIRLY